MIKFSKRVAIGRNHIWCTRQLNLLVMNVKWPGTPDPRDKRCTIARGGVYRRATSGVDAGACFSRWLAAARHTPRPSSPGIAFRFTTRVWDRSLPRPTRDAVHGGGDGGGGCTRRSLCNDNILLYAAASATCGAINIFEPRPRARVRDHDSATLQ